MMGFHCAFWKRLLLFSPFLAVLSSREKIWLFGLSLQEDSRTSLGFQWQMSQLGWEGRSGGGNWSRIQLHTFQLAAFLVLFGCMMTSFIIVV